MTNCPFCGSDPFHYVDNGIGMEAVAVTCCELGIEWFRRRNDGDFDQVSISYGDFLWLGEILIAMRKLGINPPAL